MFFRSRCRRCASGTTDIRRWSGIFWGGSPRRKASAFASHARGAARAHHVSLARQYPPARKRGCSARWCSPKPKPMPSVSTNSRKLRRRSAAWSRLTPPDCCRAIMVEDDEPALISVPSRTTRPPRILDRRSLPATHCRCSMPRRSPAAGTGRSRAHSPTDCPLPGQMSEVARRLQIGRSTLYRKLEALGLNNETR